MKFTKYPGWYCHIQSTPLVTRSTIQNLKKYNRHCLCSSPCGVSYLWANWSTAKEKTARRPLHFLQDIHWRRMACTTKTKAKLIIAPGLSLPLSKGTKFLNAEPFKCQKGAIIPQWYSTLPYKRLGFCFWSLDWGKGPTILFKKKKESIAVVWIVALLKPYTKGSRIEVHTNLDDIPQLLNLASAFCNLAF